MSDRKAEIEARLAAASEGPWEADGAEVYATWSLARPWVAESLDVDSPDQGEANAEFIAHARRDIPWLLSRLGELEAKAELAYGQGRDDEANGCPAVARGADKDQP